MPSTVFWGSPRQTQLDHAETLPAKLDLILDRLNIKERVKDKRVAIKMHLGYNVGYSMIHPVFVRKVVEAVKAGGGRPFVTDVPPSVETAHTRGYTAETVGCPLYPSTGLDEKWIVVKPYKYRNMTEFHIGGAIVDADFLIDLAHVKGHPVTGWGAAVKNLALGCMDGQTRGAMHDVAHWDPYFFKDRVRDEAHRVAIRESCPYGAIVDDKEDPDGLHMHDYKCNQCMRCVAASDGAFEPQASNFYAFQEVMTISSKLVLDTFAPGQATFINIATHMTPLCDCFGFTGLPILPDAGIFGSDDIVAVEQATADATARTPIIEDNMPGMMEIVQRNGHPFTWVHGPYKDPYYQTELAERLGMGSREYELVDVLPVTEPDFKQDTYVSAHAAAD
ncbi:MAG: DUF362 domain-containing protein [Anaerolineae bacterium]|nr:DUF362 domain-containing protein [Anaerolineae bacterium]